MPDRPFEIIPPAIKSGSVYLFTTDSGIDYEVRFARKRDNLLKATIAFGVLNDEYEGEEYVLTNKGEVYRVMHTIVQIVQMYMDEHPNVKSYEFSGEPTPKDTPRNENRRLKLYTRYLNKIFDSSWKIKTEKDKMVISKSH